MLPCFGNQLLFKGYLALTAFKPIIDPISKKIKKRRQKLDGSLYNQMPIIEVPTAPIPVHTA